REFAETLAHLGGWQYDSTRMHFNVSQGTRGFTPLQQLYNIHDHLALSDTGVPQLTPLPPTPGPVWASHQREQQTDIARLGQSITRAVASPDWTATQLVGQPTASKTFDARCSNLGFSKPGVSDNARFYAIDLSASVDAPCPVTVSMSYSTSLWVFARTDGESMQVATYPAYGLLEGFEIPPGTRSILIIAQLSHGLAAMAFAGLGALLFMILLLWHSRRPTGQ
ncbi:MAG TPA: hypothetical protein VJ998_09740, partial [Pseudomonadales bacterium]|nr:hypothetical protein [Pseudomonadales bacterium]